MKHTQFGFTILEGVVAFVILSIGLIASIKMMVNMKVSSQISQQRMQAMDYASNQLEEMRAEGLCTPVPETIQAKRTQDNALYKLQVSCVGNHATVSVTWNDSRGDQTQVNGADNQIILDSEI